MLVKGIKIFQLQCVLLGFQSLVDKVTIHFKAGEHVVIVFTKIFLWNGR